MFRSYHISNFFFLVGGGWKGKGRVSTRPAQIQVDFKYCGTSVSYFNLSVGNTARNNWKSEVLKINESLKNFCSDKLQNFRFRTLNNKS